MNQPEKSPRPRTPWIALLLLIIAPASFLATVDWSQAVNGNILELLPTSHESPEGKAARALISQKLSDPIFIRAKADVSAKELRKAFLKAAELPGFGQPFVLGDPSYQQDILSVISKHREALFAAHWLAKRQSTFTETGQPTDQFIEWLAADSAQRLDAFLDDPRSMAYAEEIPTDPLLLVPHALDGLPDAPTAEVDALIAWIPVTVDPMTSSGQATIDDSLVALEAEMQSQFPNYSQQSTGVYRIAEVSEQRSRADVSRLNTIMIVAMLGLLFIIAGRPGFLLLTTIPVLTAALWSVTAGLLIFGHIHIIAFVIASVVLGLAVDYGVHLAAHRAKSERLLNTWKRVRLPLATSAVSTCFGFLFLLLSPMGALKQVGIMAPAGLLAALLTVRWLLPWLEPLAGQYRIRPALERSWPVVNPWFWLLPAAFIWIAAASYLLHSRPFADSILTFQPPITDVLKQYRDLTQSMNHGDAADQWMVFSTSPSKLLNRLEQVRKTGFAPNMSLPVSSPENSNWANFASQSDDFAEALRQQLSAHGFEAEAFSPFFDQLANAKQWNQASAVDAAMAALSNELRGPTSALLMNDGEIWATVFPAKTDSPIPQALAPFTQEVAQTHAINRALRKARLGISRSALGGLAAIFLCVMVLYRRRAGGAILIPIWAVTLGVAATLLLGNPLGLLAIIGIILAFCLALDYGAFAASSRGHTPVSIRISALTTFTVFLILSFCTLPAVAQLGQVVAASVFFAWLAAELMCLPSTKDSPKSSSNA